MRDRSIKPAFIDATTSTDKPKVRDKDNAAPRPAPPSFVTRPAPNIAPSGMMGIRTGATPRPQSSLHYEPQNQSLKPTNDNRNDDKQWIDGKITTMKGYEFKAKLYDEPSRLGIDGGTIARLDVHKDGALVMRYDRGWMLDSKTAEHKEALHRIRNGLGDSPAREFKGLARDGDKDRGWER